MFTNKSQIFRENCVTAKFLLIRFEGKKRKYRLFRVLTHIFIMVVVERIPKNHVILIHQVQSLRFQCYLGIFDCLTHFKFLLIRFEGKKRKYRLFRVLTHIFIMVVVERIPKNHVILIHQVQSLRFQCYLGIFDCLTHFSPMSHFYTPKNLSSQWV